MFHGKVFPYSSIIIDAQWTDFFRATQACVLSSQDRGQLLNKLRSLWTTTQNSNPVLPVLSVRTAFDIYLRLMNFPEGSEVIMSAINIPDMCYIVHYHGLKIVPLDINIDDLSPKAELFEALVTPRTRLVVVAHIYGKWFDLDPLIDLAHKHALPVIEDCAEGFHGLTYVGNPRSDLALFSFGSIKYATAFGGAIAKVRDMKLYAAMTCMNDSYPVQSQKEFLKKVLKYGVVRLLTNVRPVTGFGFSLARAVNFDVQKMVVGMVRGFPNDLIRRLRHRPCIALLATLVNRQTNYRTAENMLSLIKGEYMAGRLPEGAFAVGQKAHINNYWLFPVIVERPEEVVRHLYELGVHAYRGATQLNLVNSDVIDNEVSMTTKNLGNQVTPKEASLANDSPRMNSHIICQKEREVLGHAIDSTSSAKSQNSPLATNESHRATGLPVSSSDDASNPLDKSQPHNQSQNISGSDYQQLYKKSDDDSTSAQKANLHSLRTFPHEAKYLMDHVVYLPVHKLVPFTQLDYLAECVTLAVARSLNGDQAKGTTAEYRPKLKSNL